MSRIEPPQKRRRSRRGRGLAAGLLAAALVSTTAGCAAAVKADESPTLSFADTYSPKHPVGEFGVTVFLDELKKRGIDTDYYPAGQMGTSEDLASLVVTDTIDMGPSAPAYLEDYMPLSSVGDLPNMTRDSCAAANSMLDLLSKGGILYQEEYHPAGLHALFVATVPGYEIITTDKQVRDVNDARGLLLRSSGGAFDITMEAIGASAVSMPGGDTYEAMSRHTVDGTALGYVSATSYDLGQIADYSTDGLNLGAVSIPYAINDVSWNRLSPQAQSDVTEAAAIAQKSLCMGINNANQKAKQDLAASGVELTKIDGTASDEWNTRLDKVKTDWATSLDGTGRPGTEVLREFEAEMHRYEHQ
jgi:TRAP-type C4-dicarboxylate transport system substrate-binding protein